MPYIVRAYLHAGIAFLMVRKNPDKARYHLNIAKLYMAMAS